jgi:hypothetical protein
MRAERVVGLRFDVDKAPAIRVSSPQAVAPLRSLGRVAVYHDIVPAAQLRQPGLRSCAQARGGDA